MDLVALMVDGLGVAEHTGVVALGSPGRDQGPAGPGRGATEGATEGAQGLTGLRDPGLDLTRPILV
jgi:putative transposase